LHVHTPSSVVSHYPGTDPWDSFLSDLANLPPNMRVVGINDYWFIDGYRRVAKEWSAGNLPNLEAVFPVIELRIDQLSGTEGHLSRINLHVLFEPGTDPDAIEAQFVNGLSAAFRLDSDARGTTWSGFPTRKNLVELGQRIRASTPIEKRTSLAGSDLLLGFSNLVVPRERVRSSWRLRSSRIVRLWESVRPNGHQ
jgi:hypothetical protein